MMFDKISKAQIKHVRLLQQKKYRQKYNQFIVEGIKSVDEFVNSKLNCVAIYGNESYLNLKVQQVGKDKCFLSDAKQLAQISNLKTPQEVLAVIQIPIWERLDLSQKIILVLDDIRDPGNLGTIIRTAEWFGLNEIVCSNTSTDCYNPKVIQASMGSMSRMKVHYKDLKSFVSEAHEHRLVIADMVGEDYREYVWGKSLLVIGNEGQGVSDYIRKMEKDKITIPSKGNAESLNAAISTAVILSRVC